MNGLATAATVAQAVGFDIGGLISKIGQAARTARQNTKDCEHLARRVGMLAELVPCLQDPEARRVLAGLDATLLEAHDLVMSCQRKGLASHLFSASRLAERFRDVDRKIQTHLSVIPVVSYIAIARRLDHTTSRSQSQQLLTPTPLLLDFLKSITGNFSDELGRGGFGVVYKGVLGDGKIIAVKKLRDGIHLADNDDQFRKEVTYLTGLKHQNIVQLIGYCDEYTKERIQQMSDGTYVDVERRHRLICFEYLSNKSLDNYLSDESSGLDWHIRYEIIKGICRGLHYLHKECNIVHLDLKPQNILMDDNMTPKIADFGLSRLFGEQQSRIITNNCRGTLGYMAQEYMMNGLISTKSDIFSLGVIIIEILIGSKEYPQSYQAPYEYFIENVARRWRNKLEKTWKDEPLEIYCRQVKASIEIGMTCVDPEPKNRPAAWDVIKILDACNIK